MGETTLTKEQRETLTKLSKDAGPLGAAACVILDMFRRHGDERRVVLYDCEAAALSAHIAELSADLQAVRRELEEAREQADVARECFRVARIAVNAAEARADAAERRAEVAKSREEQNAEVIAMLRRAGDEADALLASYRDVLGRLVAKLDAFWMNSLLRSVWEIHQLRGSPYDGPQYDLELATARELLASTEVAAVPVEPPREADRCVCGHIRAQHIAQGGVVQECLVSTRDGRRPVEWCPCTQYRVAPSEAAAEGTRDQAAP